MLKFYYLQIWKRKVKICATQLYFNPAKFATIKEQPLIIEVFQMKLAYILFLHICLLAIPNSYSNTIVNKVDSTIATQSFLEVLTPCKALFGTALSESNQLKFVFLENTSETEKCSTSLPAFPVHLNGKSLRDNCFVYTKSVKLNNQGLLERNITPFRNISRKILFHSLQIHF